MSLTLYFLRHGQTTMSRADNFCGSGLDPELTQEGLEMAQAFAAAYRDKHWSAIFTSILQRSITTAQPLCDALGMITHPSPADRPGIPPMEKWAELNEIGYGKWEGLSKATVEREYHDDYISWLADPAWHAPTGGELAITIAQRSLQVIQEIKERFDDGNILIVSHKATIRIILCGLLGIDVGRFRYRLVCPVGSISIVEFTSQGPLLQALADRSHLSEALRSLPGT
jgi:probable phosphoglycerate mutase